MSYARIKQLAAAAAISLLTAAAAPAAVTTIAQYDLGEAGSLGSADKPIDSVGGHDFAHNFHSGFTLVNDPAAIGSTAALGVDTNSGFYGVAAGSTTFATDNFGFSLWVRTSTTQTKDIFMTNAQNTNSLKLSQVNNNWAASLHGTSWIGVSSGVSNSVKPGQWAQIAVVRDGGNYSFYINGIHYGTVNPSGTAPIIDINQFHLAVQPGGGSGSWTGDLDNLRAFTFTTGNFQARDLGLGLINGSFEADPSNSLTAQAWTLTGNAKVGNFETASDGANAIIFNSGNTTPNAVLSQSFNTLAGHEYQLTFDFHKYGGGAGTAGLGVNVFDSTFGDTKLQLDESVSTLSSSFVTYTYKFTAAGDLTTLRFTDTSSATDSYDGILDNVAVTAVPNPAALPAGALLLGLAAMRRRRNA